MANLLGTKIPYRYMTQEQQREYERIKYQRRRDEINARRRELYRLKKEIKSKGVLSNDK